MVGALSESYISNSSQVRFYHDEAQRVLYCTFGDIDVAGTSEFLESVSAMGDCMKRHDIGFMCMDISNMKNFNIPTRMAIVRNLKRIFLDKVPFLVLAVVKGKSVFENMTMQLAISASMPLSNKFRDSKMFDSERDAVEWLLSHGVHNQK
jgi:hypothetical protein